jgi:hypothetical protein
MMDTEVKLLIVGIVAALAGAVIGGGSVWMVLGNFTRALLKDVSTQNRAESSLTAAGTLEAFNTLANTLAGITREVGRYIPIEALEPINNTIKWLQRISDGLPNEVEPAVKPGVISGAEGTEG